MTERASEIIFTVEEAPEGGLVARARSLDLHRGRRTRSPARGGA
jgi:hypothetical protein